MDKREKFIFFLPKTGHSAVGSDPSSVSLWSLPQATEKHQYRNQDRIVTSYLLTPTISDTVVQSGTLLNKKVTLHKLETTSQDIYTESYLEQVKRFKGNSRL